MIVLLNSRYILVLTERAIVSTLQRPEKLFAWIGSIFSAQLFPIFSTFHPFSQLFATFSISLNFPQIPPTFTIYLNFSQQNLGKCFKNKTKKGTNVTFFPLHVCLLFFWNFSLTYNLKSLEKIIRNTNASENLVIFSEIERTNIDCSFCFKTWDWNFFSLGTDCFTVTVRPWLYLAFMIW